MLCIRTLSHESDNDRAEIHRIFQEAPTYTQLVEGRPPSEEDVEDFFFGKPSNKEAKDKAIVGFSVGTNMIGCADLIRGSSADDCLWIGLLLFSEKHQGQGYGSEAVVLIEAMAREWAYRRLQLGAVATNPRALAFWQGAGFKEIRRLKNPRFTGELIVMERKLRGPSP
ncbi:GNAT family N-acetyltransferase [Paraburkholderia sp.]|uniref:GNAT family N-acetyltransferase n=1 Tax=Paraburkholderia sp. TaxID=1926495 RepID=UPI0023937EA8|nr:GNAT family N-acetyltransferase [Paraburkholderia sp.]MDE1180008.1 GNAT family N-acetyltransferase [Paraburkholderia sp.]